MPTGYPNNGKPHPSWFKKGHKGIYRGHGGRIDHEGYIRVLVGRKNNHTEYQLEHRMIMEKRLGRKLKNEEIVHHIDGNRKNNSVDNLMLFSSHREHAVFHS